MKRVRLNHEPKEVSHRFKQLLELEMHLLLMAVLSNVLLKTPDEELVREHGREVLGDVDVQDRVKVLVLVILKLTEDGHLRERVHVSVWILKV
jgi:hypothetical protein